MSLNPTEGLLNGRKFHDIAGTAKLRAATAAAATSWASRQREQDDWLKSKRRLGPRGPRGGNGSASSIGRTDFSNSSASRSNCSCAPPTRLRRWPLLSAPTEVSISACYGSRPAAWRRPSSGWPSPSRSRHPSERESASWCCEQVGGARRLLEDGLKDGAARLGSSRTAPDRQDMGFSPDKTSR